MAINIKVMWEYLGTIALVLVAVIPIKFAIVYANNACLIENWPAIRTSVLLAMWRVCLRFISSNYFT